MRGTQPNSDQLHRQHHLDSSPCKGNRMEYPTTPEAATMDRPRSDTATLGDPDAQRDPAFCDCGRLDLSAVLAACAPESLARLGEPTSKPFLHMDLQFRRGLELRKSFCTFFRFISTLWLRSPHAEDFSHVKVRIYLSSSSSREAANLDPDLAHFAPFLVIAFAPGGPPGRPPRWSQFKEYTFTSAHKTELGFPIRQPRGLRPTQLQTWEAHLECSIDQKPNWEGIKMALSGCRSQHSSSCGRLDPRLGRIPGLHVIDCATRTLIPFPDDVVIGGAQYATLSYVWGAATEAPTISPGSRLPDDIPLVVADAISACSHLGLQYLWVDRYCIPQDDAESKHAQIRNMNLIYKQSALTIIAAAGSGPTIGLPGVSQHRPNVPQRSIQKLGPHIIVPIMTDAELLYSHDGRMQAFAGSAWNNRGWTYQEAVVSRRRLVFTNRLIIFQCWESKWDERFDRTVSTSPVAHSNATPGVPRLFPHGPIGFDARDFEKHATEYFGRKFTYISDQLPAFLGILQEFALSPAALRHLCAVPVYQPSSPLVAARLPMRLKSRLRQSEKLMSVLDGNASLREAASPTLAGFVLGLSWNLVPRAASGVRASARLNEAGGLPSWSWMGWCATSRAYWYNVSFALDPGFVDYTARAIPENYHIMAKEIQVGFGSTESGSKVPNDTELALDIAIGLGRLDALYLHITAWVFEARFMQRPAGHKPIDGYDRPPYYANLVQTGQAANAASRFDLVGSGDVGGATSQSATFVVMFSVEESLTVCLALQPCVKHGNGKCFQRMGLLYLRREQWGNDETWKPYFTRSGKAGDKKKKTMFGGSFLSEVCRMTSVYVC